MKKKRTVREVADELAAVHGQALIEMASEGYVAGLQADHWRKVGSQYIGGIAKLEYGVTKSLLAMARWHLRNGGR